MQTVTTNENSDIDVECISGEKKPKEIRERPCVEDGKGREKNKNEKIYSSSRLSGPLRDSSF